MTSQEKPTPGPFGESECDGCIMNDGPLHGGAYVDCCAFVWPQPYLHVHECPMSAYEPRGEGNER